MIPTHAPLWPTRKRWSSALLAVGCALATMTLAGCGDSSPTEASAFSPVVAAATAPVRSASRANGKGRPTIPTGGRLEREKMRARGEAPK
jgi:hypothetical protein